MISRRDSQPVTTLTIFTVPKPFFNPHIATIQRNAIQSWLHLGEEVEVLLIGQEPGLTELATELEALGLPIRHLPAVMRNSFGTPLISSIFALARQASQSPNLAYLNADILALPDLVQAARVVSAQSTDFLLVGQRWDLDVTRPLDFSPGWPERLRLETQKRGHLHPPQGSDYFIFPRHLFTELPDLAVGRAGWDNWMIYYARKNGWATIDATSDVMIIHQSHDYSHLPEGKPHYDLEESDRNTQLAGGLHHLYTILDTNWQLEHGKLRRPSLTFLRALRSMEVWLTPKDGRRKGWQYALARRFRRWRRARTGEIY
jgi:hypothetical protein